MFVFCFLTEIFNDLNKDLISKYFLVVFTLSFIHSFRVEHDYLVNANENMLKHRGSDKKLPSNFKLKSLLKQAVKRGRDFAASQEAPGTGKINSMISKKLEIQLLPMNV